MKAILSLIKIDSTNGLRDSLILYILLAPILLSFGLRLFIPGFEQAKPPVVIVAPQDFWESESADRFAQRFDLTPATSREELEILVMKRDSRVGIILEPSGNSARSSARQENPGSVPYSNQIVFQGNEREEYRQLVHGLVLSVIAGVEIPLATSGPSPLFQYGAVILSMMASLIGGLAVAFVMIEEKEQNLTRCYAITPVTSWTYYSARGITAAGLGLVLALIGHGIVSGFGFRLTEYLFVLVASAPLALMIALLVGGIARNQIQGIAVLKIVMALFLTVPLVSIFLGESWQPIFYLFPNYWMFKALESVYVTQPAVIGPWIFTTWGTFAQAIVTFVLGMIGVGILIKIQGKELKPGW